MSVRRPGQKHSATVQVQAQLNTPTLVLYSLATARRSILHSSLPPNIKRGRSTSGTSTKRTYRVYRTSTNYL